MLSLVLHVWVIGYLISLTTLWSYLKEAYKNDHCLQWDVEGACLCYFFALIGIFAWPLMWIEKIYSKRKEKREEAQKREDQVELELARLRVSYNDLYARILEKGCSCPQKKQANRKSR